MRRCGDDVAHVGEMLLAMLVVMLLHRDEY
jgi:hypothetical protein